LRFARQPSFFFFATGSPLLSSRVLPALRGVLSEAVNAGLALALRSPRRLLLSGHVLSSQLTTALLSTDGRVRTFQPLLHAGAEGLDLEPSARLGSRANLATSAHRPLFFFFNCFAMQSRNFTFPRFDNLEHNLAALRNRECSRSPPRFAPNPRWIFFLFLGIEWPSKIAICPLI